MTHKRMHLFGGYGIELEYMITDRKDLSVRPISDRILLTGSGQVVSELDSGALKWSNELVMHVLELKTGDPVASIHSLQNAFQNDILKINRLLDPHEARLMPTAMHPWMDPLRETRIWPHRYNAIYETFNRIFDCRGHGWSNLQSMHINLPFADDSEFERLHAAVRLALPLIPALSAGSPIVEGKLTGSMDNRMEFYRTNQNKIPSLVGLAIPEPIYSKKEYQDKLLKKLYADILPFDPEKALQHEWLNSRGAIARFDRNTIEIRIIDMQECPLADLSIAAALIALIRWLIEEKTTDLKKQKQFSTEILSRILFDSIRQADSSRIEDAEYLSFFGIQSSSASTGQVWKRLFDSGLTDSISREYRKSLQTIMEKGPLSKRIVRSLGESFTSEKLAAVYRKLCDCLDSGVLFD